jgi:hypothetical protein
MMMGREDKPHVEWDERNSSTSFKELFRYRKVGRTRAYNLRPLDEDRAELWVVSEGESKERKSRRLVTFDSPEDARAFLDDVERELRAGGWWEA